MADATDLKSVGDKAQDSQSPTFIDTAPKSRKNDGDLQAVIEAWPSLPADVRRTIAGVIKATLKASSRKGRGRVSLAQTLVDDSPRRW